MRTSCVFSMDLHMHRCPVCTEDGHNSRSGIPGGKRLVPLLKSHDFVDDLIIQKSVFLENHNADCIFFVNVVVDLVFDIRSLFLCQDFGIHHVSTTTNTFFHMRCYLGCFGEQQLPTCRQLQLTMSLAYAHYQHHASNQWLCHQGNTQFILTDRYNGSCYGFKAHRQWMILIYWNSMKKCFVICK